MFDLRTVIILGAGASAPAGFPLGADLRRDIISGIKRLRKEIDNSDYGSTWAYSETNADQFIESPFTALLSYATSEQAKHLLPEGIRDRNFMEVLSDLETDLSSQPAETIDRFIWANPKHRFIGKVLLSMQIMLKMYSPDGRSRYMLRTFDDPFFASRPNWYGQLVNQLQWGAPNASALKDNNLHIITFNYDQSLERALQASLGKTELHKGADYKDVLDIFHVNGTPEKLPEQIFNAGEFIFECAQSFHLVAEEVGSGLEGVRAKARSAIASAKRIYVMGFNFDQSNVETIGLQNARMKEQIFCLNYDGDVGVTQDMVQFRISHSNIMKGTAEQPIQMDEAISQGFLRQ